eukprot:gene5744-11005_t
MVCGWVCDVVSKKIERKCLVKAKVLHSQKLSEKPLQPWVVAEMGGRILSCQCVAGLGETCTHVAALLFSIEAMVKMRFKDCNPRKSLLASSKCYEESRV